MGKVETELTKQIMDLVRAEGGWCFKHHASSGSYKGVPDIIGAIKGKGLFIEVKAPGGKPDRMQEHVLDKLAEAGGLAFWADSVESVQAVLDGF